MNECVEVGNKDSEGSDGGVLSDEENKI